MAIVRPHGHHLTSGIGALMIGRWTAKIGVSRERAAAVAAARCVFLVVSWSAGDGK
jgi:hypothetical protein